MNSLENFNLSNICIFLFGKYIFRRTIKESENNLNLMIVLSYRFPQF